GVEMGRVLEESGEPVEWLVVIDALIENTNPVMLHVERWVRLFSRLLGGSERDHFERVLAIRRWLERLDRLATGAAPGLSTDRIAAGDPITCAYHLARRAYVPKRYGGRMIVLHRTGEGFDPRWLKIAPNLE